MTKTFFAWALKTNEKSHNGFIGMYWWFEENEYIPEKLKGGQIALFETRSIARKNLPWVKKSYPKASVVKVKITVEED
jgi:hypothetical protein